MERVTLVGGQMMYAHSADRCEGKPCCIHNPSDHHMVEWHQFWRDDVSKMERICPHGIGHPDPDDLMFRLSIDYESAEWVSTHACDGCCKGEDLGSGD